MCEQEVGLVKPEDAFEETATGRVVTGQRIFVDGDSDKEYVVLDPVSGASSSAPANSGIPSAVTQQRARTEEQGKPSVHTPMGGRVQTHEANHIP